MLSVVGEKSFGLLPIVPKTEDGTPVGDFTARIIRDAASGNEVKEWAALAAYLRSFAAVDGLPQIPAYYSRTQGRKNIDDDKTIAALLRRPNRIAVAAYSLAAALAVMVACVPVVIFRRRRKGRAITG